MEEETRRGSILTTLAVLFALLALSNISKPLSGGRAGFVFLGTKTAGMANAILGPGRTYSLIAPKPGQFDLDALGLLRSVATRLVGVFVIMGLLLGNARATSIVSIVIGDEIAIAADGKVIGTKSGTTTICKIRRQGNLWFATAGLFYKSEVDFEIERLVRLACRRGRDVDGAVIALRELIMTPLRDAMRYSKIHDPKGYTKYYSGRPVVAVIFAGYSHSHPRMVMQRFNLNSTGNIVEKDNDLLDRNGNNLALAGETDAITKYQSGHRGWAHSLTPPQVVAFLVQLEIAADPSQVGPPMAILDLRPGRSSWIERGACGATDPLD